MKSRVVSRVKVVSSSTDPWRPPHRRKARKRGRMTNREQASGVKRNLRDREACPTPGKVAHATKHHAKQALKRARPIFARTERERDAEQPGHAGLGMPRAYRCRCGRWHIGHLPKHIRSGPDHRDGFEAAA